MGGDPFAAGEKKPSGRSAGLKGPYDGALTKGCEVHDRTTHQDVGHLERATARRDRRQDVVVLAQLDRSYARRPVEDLQVPGAALIAHLCGDEVENVARASNVGQGRDEPRALHRGSAPIRRDYVVDDVALADQLSGLRRARDLGCGFVLDDLMVVET